MRDGITTKQRESITRQDGLTEPIDFNSHTNSIINFVPTFQQQQLNMVSA